MLSCVFAAAIHSTHHFDDYDSWSFVSFFINKVPHILANCSRQVLIKRTCRVSYVFIRLAFEVRTELGTVSQGIHITYFSECFQDV